MASKQMQDWFEHIQLSDTYTRNIVFGFTRRVSRKISFSIPNIIYELIVCFYYAGEHFAWLGYEMWIKSEDDEHSLQHYNNIIQMTSDTEWNTCYGQVIVDTKLQIKYVYEWTLQINTKKSAATSIGFGISTEYECCDDAFWISSPYDAIYYAFTASVNTNAQTLSVLSSDPSTYVTYDRWLKNRDRIKLRFDVYKRTLQCILLNNLGHNATENNEKIIVHNIEINKNANYHLAISMCGQYNVRLLDFKRTRCNETMIKKTKQSYFESQQKKNKNKEDENESDNDSDFGSIEIGIFSKSIWASHHSEDHLRIHYKVNDVLTLKEIFCDYQFMKSRLSRQLFVSDFAKKNIQICEFESIEEVYGLIEVIILFVIRHRYKNSIICSNYYQKVSEFVEWIVYEKDNMDSKAWNIEAFAKKFDDILCNISIKTNNDNDKDIETVT